MLLVFLYACVKFYPLLSCLGLCIHHHSQDTARISVLPFYNPPTPLWTPSPVPKPCQPPTWPPLFNFCHFEIFYQWNLPVRNDLELALIFCTAQFSRDPSKLLQVSTVHFFPQLVTPFTLCRTSGLILVFGYYNTYNDFFSPAIGWQVFGFLL